MAALRYEQVLLGVAAVIAATSFSWFGFEQLHPRSTRRPTSSSTRFVLLPPSHLDPAEKADDRSVTRPAPREKTARLSDLFTSPKINYEARAKRFVAAPDDSAGGPPSDANRTKTPFGLELRRVSRERFRLQLVGYIGSDRGVFENTVTAETFLAGPGRSVRELGLTITDFHVRRPAAQSSNAPTQAAVATATVVDEKTGESVVLTSAERCFTRALIATVALSGTPRDERVVREGDVLAADGGSYTISKIHASPPTVEITPAFTDGRNCDRRILTLSDPDEIKKPPAPSTH